MACWYTVAMAIGAIVLATGAYFNPIASIFGGFAGLYVAAITTGKIGFKLSGEPHKTGNKVVAHKEMEDLIKGNGLPGSGEDPML